MSFPIKVNSNTIELTVHTSCYCVLDLLCVTMPKCDASSLIALRNLWTAPSRDRFIQTKFIHVHLNSCKCSELSSS